jgi:pimeloyl-ACP methyl ester carboxylesterase
MKQHVDDLVAVIESLSSEPVHLVGHSGGALVCLRAAMERPELIRAMVLEEPPAVRLLASIPPQPAELLKLFLTRPGVAAALIKFGAGGVAPAVRAFDRGDDEAGLRHIGRAVFGTKGFERLSADRLAQSRDNITTVKAEFSGPGFMPLSADELAEVRVPVLLISGQHSIRLFRHLSNRLEALLPTVDHIEIPDTCHLMHEQAPDAFNRAVLSFLNGQSTA